MLATIDSYIRTQSCGTCKVLLDLDKEYRVCFKCKYFFHVKCVKSKILNKL
jgi:acetyl-CoA carboxylase beta subunit